MSLNFFASCCQEPPRNEECFGICDDPKRKAYTSIENKNQWIAIVDNKSKRSLTFTAIDKCVIKDSDFPGHDRCDGMLTSNKHLYLIELKNKKEKWKNKAIKQLESTIQFLKDNHPEELKTFIHKKAFACNRKRGPFVSSKIIKQNEFFRANGFRLEVQMKVIVV